ncbi:glycosyl hydrolase family 28 protein [uncultured Bacteroides sp.]|uniref:glycoside hydrolase family 28 protein n=1 Tax=uncultured Bacteroides sp. TaxID=162156 RepID=UPI002AA5E9A4|nr:glycosyl hydrolase family 28 protein [uncultured Bacteroides sp.]
MKKYILISLFLLFTFSAWGRDYNIVTQGKAVGDGKTLNTKLIQQAIDQLAKKGGGRIVFPKGIYLTGCIRLKSGVDLNLEREAVLLGSTNPDDYYPLEEAKDNAKANDNSKLALILGYNVKNITLNGEGTIDGQGLELALNIDSLHHAGVRIDSHYNMRRMRTSETVRPKLFLLSECGNISITGLHLRNSACWGLTFDLCSDLVIDQVCMENRAYWNNDGFDITDCRRVRITRCNVNAADDGICLKSYHPTACNDSIYIADCEVRSSASAIKFGTASWGGFKNITIDNIRVFDTFRSAIAIESVDGGNIENINVSRITAKNTGNALFIRLGHRAGERVGTIKNISIKDMNVEIPFDRPDISYDLRGPEVDFFHNPFPSPIVGIPGHYIEGVHLENIEITCPGRATKGMAYIPLTRLNQVPEQIDKYPEFSMFGELPSWGFYIRHVKDITFRNVKLNLSKSDFRPAIILDDVKGEYMEQISLPQEKKEFIIRVNN